MIELIHSDLRKTNLFLRIDIQPIFQFEEKGGIRFRISVQENWYIYPSLLVEISDRNFNVWWNEHDHTLKRLNLGLGINHVNFTGAKDQIKLKAQGGYLRKMQVYYNRPALVAKSKLGLFAALNYFEHREIVVQIENNKPVYQKGEGSKIYFNKEVILGTNYQHNKLWNYFLELHYFHNKLDPEQAIRYPSFLLTKTNIQQYGFAQLSASYFDMDHALRPTRGLQLNWTLKKAGLGFGDDLHYLNISQTIRACKKLLDQFFLQTTITGEIALERKQKPLNIYKAYDYNESGISGYEYYEINGLDFIYNHNEMRYYLGAYTSNLLNRLFNKSNFLIRTDLDLSFQLNTAYVHDPFYFQTNDLTNKVLFSMGPGLNFTINEVFQFNINYSVNHLKEDGIYFHTRKTF